MTQSVCIQGLGFVGSAMAVACARAVPAGVGRSSPVTSK
jgi:UDP-N-acetyl-D-mannosaminuronate dehydrogenase